MRLWLLLVLTKRGVVVLLRWLLRASIVCSVGRGIELTGWVRLEGAMRCAAKLMGLCRVRWPPWAYPEATRPLLLLLLLLILILLLVLLLRRGLMRLRAWL